jgi:RNA polymerase sigma-70 factor (ECF subfamily)
LVEETTPANSLENEQMLAEVRNAISKLDHEHRKVITLVDMEGMSYRDVAEALELRIGTVMSRLHRARGKLRLLLKEVLQDEQDNKGVKPSVLWRVK